MSLTHGHYYAAKMMQEAIRSENPALVSVLDQNTNEYLIGAVGPDIVYWSDAAGDKTLKDIFPVAANLPGVKDVPICIWNLDLWVDLHTLKTGELIKNLLRDFKDLRELSGEGKEPILAFILGWITHWVTDIYIHTVVDMYGGKYESSTAKHVQLELVETKHLGATEVLPRTLLVPNNEVFRFLAGPIARTYPNARIKAAGDPDRLSARPDELAGPFARSMSYGLEVINVAFTCAEEAHWSGTGSCSLGWQKLAESGWESKGAFVPSNALYAGIKRPLSLSEVTAGGSGVTAVLDVEDSGLYGRFLVDYREFIAAAIVRGTRIFQDIGAFVDNWLPVEQPALAAAGSGARLRSQLTLKEIGEKLSRWSCLEGHFTINDKDIDILEPERFMRDFDPEIWGKFESELSETVENRGKTRLDNSEVDDVYVELECNLGGKPYRDRRKIEAAPRDVSDLLSSPDAGTASDIVRRGIHRRMFGSRAGRAYLNIPVENPGNAEYTYLLKVSLTDKEAFATKRYEGLEFVVAKSPSIIPRIGQVMFKIPCQFRITGSVERPSEPLEDEMTSRGYESVVPLVWNGLTTVISEKSEQLQGSPVGCDPRNPAPPVCEPTRPPLVFTQVCTITIDEAVTKIESLGVQWSKEGETSSCSMVFRDIPLVFKTELGRSNLAFYLFWASQMTLKDHVDSIDWKDTSTVTKIDPKTHEPVQLLVTSECMGLRDAPGGIMVMFCGASDDEIRALIKAGKVTEAEVCQAMGRLRDAITASAIGN